MNQQRETIKQTGRTDESSTGFHQLNVDEQLQLIREELTVTLGQQGPALLQLYLDWSGHSWKTKFGWMRTCNLKKWTGVEATPEPATNNTTSARVIGGIMSIHLPVNNLIGQLQDTVARLSTLQELDLSGNYLEGEFG